MSQPHRLQYALKDFNVAYLYHQLLIGGAFPYISSTRTLVRLRLVVYPASNLRYLTAISTALVKAPANDTDTTSVVMTSRVNHLRAVLVCRSMSADNSSIQLLAA
jgi:hypothetical protein